MYKGFRGPIRKTHHISLSDSNTEIRLKELVKNIESDRGLYIINWRKGEVDASSDRLSDISDFYLLNKYLDSMNLTKVMFNGTTIINDSKYLNDSRYPVYLDTKTLMRKIANIPIVEFVGCRRIPPEFYKRFLNIPQHKTVELIFKYCDARQDSKVIISNLKNNYSIRSLIIYETKNRLTPEDTNDEIKINEILFRNRARYLCKKSSLALILIKRYNNKYFNLVDKPLVIFIAKLVLSTKTDPKWLEVISDSVL
jgi:hypothetical protein